MYIKLLDEKILNVSKFREDKDIEDVRYFNDLIICKEKKTGTMYKVSQVEPNILCYDDVEWEKMKSWEVDASRHMEPTDSDTITEVNLYDEYLCDEIEENNSYYVEDDVYAGHEATNHWKEGFEC
jgi:hypothetical protein